VTYIKEHEVMPQEMDTQSSKCISTMAHFRPMMRQQIGDSEKGHMRSDAVRAAHPRPQARERLCWGTFNLTSSTAGLTM